MLKRYIKSLVRKEMKEQIRKETLRRRIIEVCADIQIKHGYDKLSEYQDRSEYIKNLVEEKLKYLSEQYGIDIRAKIYCRTSNIFHTRYDEYNFEVREKGEKKWVDIDEW